MAAEEKRKMKKLFAKKPAAKPAVKKQRTKKHAKEEDDDRILCTACGKEIRRPQDIHWHDLLGVPTCEWCYNTYHHGEFTTFYDGTEMFCRWCGDGGKLYNCDRCPKSWCGACIQRNFGKYRLKLVESSKGTWRCFCCDRKLIDLMRRRFHERWHLRLSPEELAKGDLLMEDISRGREEVPIPCFNSYDWEDLEGLCYVSQPYPRGGDSNVVINSDPSFLPCCDCTDGCVDPTKCACLALSDGPNYTYDGLLINKRTWGVFECNHLCRCNKKACQNRIVGNGIKVKMEVFRCGDGKGWGVRAGEDIRKGTFIASYLGEIIKDSDAETESKVKGDEYLWSTDMWLSVMAGWRMDEAGLRQYLPEKEREKMYEQLTELYVNITKAEREAAASGLTVGGVKVSARSGLFSAAASGGSGGGGVFRSSSKSRKSGGSRKGRADGAAAHGRSASGTGSGGEMFALAAAAASGGGVGGTPRKNGAVASATGIATTCGVDGSGGSKGPTSAVVVAAAAASNEGCAGVAIAAVSVGLAAVAVAANGGLGGGGEAVAQQPEQVSCCHASAPSSDDNHKPHDYVEMLCGSMVQKDDGPEVIDLVTDDEDCRMIESPRAAVEPIARASSAAASASVALDVVPPSIKLEADVECPETEAEVREEDPAVIERREKRMLALVDETYVGPMTYEERVYQRERMRELRGQEWEDLSEKERFELMEAVEQERDDHMNEMEKVEGVAIDAKWYGNVARFFNHSCDPVMGTQLVFVDNHDHRFVRMALFATENIKKGEEMTWHYGYKPGQVEGKTLKCLCGAQWCQGSLL